MMAQRSFLFTLGFVAVAATVAGCGRSSLLGGGQCPANLRQPDGTCLPVFDLATGDGPLSCPVTCVGGDTVNCSDPACCGCAICSSVPACRRPDMGGGDGGDRDMADPCSMPSGCVLEQCKGDPRCHTPGVEICNNGIDDDDDNLIDCKDPDCATFAGCQSMHMCPTPPDCEDPACVDDPACIDLRCDPTVNFGHLAATGSSSTRQTDTRNTTDVAITPCAPGGAGMVVGVFDLDGKADLTLSYTQPVGEDHVFGLFRAGIGQTCGSNPLECYDPNSKPSGSHTYAALPAGRYYVIIQPFEPGGAGPVTVTLSTPTLREICNNGVDDNGNGLIDCADSDCAGTPACITQECVPDFNVGALVVNAPGKMVSFDTLAGDAQDNLTCQGARGGGDVVVRFTLRETAGILLQWNQTGDHVVGLMRTPAQGLNCDADQISCYDPSGRMSDTVAWTDQPPGDYLFIFKALQPGAEGHIDATISAYRNRQVELCHNGIDDDGNGLTDCADPACSGVAGCLGPYCMPNVQLGTMPVGTSQRVHLNIAQDGTVGYNTPCARGSARGEVVQLTVPSGSGIGIGFDCQQTGDHVIDLFAAGGPRDTCDANELVCADPKTLPFGCAYEVPNLQPGTYNVIVEGFQPGSEGTMDLTLSVVSDRALEICNNGIDDDGDGAIDCADRKCATQPACVSLQCRPDKTIDPVPLNGTQTFVLVQTAGNGVAAHPTCTTVSGGMTAVVKLRLTAAADLTLQWNQFGNHDFALYTVDGATLPCDAGTQLFCRKSNDATTGSTSFTNVPAGQYYLVVAADAPDGTTMSSGSVGLALSGMPH